MRSLFWGVAFGLMPAVAVADGYFGTQQEAKVLADAMIAIVDRDGVTAAVQAMHDTGQPFVGSLMGVNLFSGSTVVADNREPETIAADYSTTVDLNGEMVWPLISAAADVEGDANLKWYHYDTQEAYDYKCFSKRSDTVDVTVMVCR